MISHEGLPCKPRGRRVAYDPSNVGINFLLIEEDYYGNIRSNSFHCVANSQLRARGQVGESASLEICYTMLYHRQIFATDRIQVAEHVNPRLSAIINRNLDKVVVFEINRMRPHDLRRTIEGYLTHSDYKFDSGDEQFIELEVKHFFAKLASEAE